MRGFKEQLNTRSRPEEAISAQDSQDSSTAKEAFSTPLNPFNVTPELTQAAILQKSEKESSTPPPAVNPAFLTPPPTVKTPSQAPKRKRSRIQFVNYLGDINGDHGKKKKRTRHKKFRVSYLVLLRAFISLVFQLILLKFFLLFCVFIINNSRFYLGVFT